MEEKDCDKLKCKRNLKLAEEKTEADSVAEEAIN